jgi:2-methylcitrate dehydratase PrpD
VRSKSPPFAAFLNAFASHVLDLDDVYNLPGTTVHGSCSVWPAILAIADDRPVSGRDALASFALGFEVQTRVAHAAGLRIMPGSDLKSMHPGKAAMDGVLAATVVEHRRTASAKALEGDFGYLAVMSAAPAPEKMSAGLGATWNITSNGHERCPSGSLTHPMVDGIIALVTENDVAPGDVTVIDVRVSPPAARFTDLPRPATPEQTKFSLRHCAAAAVVFRRLGTEELSSEVRGNRGTPPAPLGDDELGVKFRERVGPVLGTERAERLLATCWRVDEHPDLSVPLEQTVGTADG